MCKQKEEVVKQPQEEEPQQVQSWQEIRKEEEVLEKMNFANSHQL